MMEWSWRGRDFESPDDGQWREVPDEHGLLSYAHRLNDAGTVRYFWFVRWYPAGYWYASFKVQRRIDGGQLKQKQGMKFHSEDEAKRYLETFSALYREPA